MKTLGKGLRFESENTVVARAISAPVHVNAVTHVKCFVQVSNPASRRTTSSEDHQLGSDGSSVYSSADSFGQCYPEILITFG